MITRTRHSGGLQVLTRPRHNETRSLRLNALVFTPMGGLAERREGRLFNPHIQHRTLEAR